MHLTLRIEFSQDWQNNETVLSFVGVATEELYVRYSQYQILRFLFTCVPHSMKTSQNAKRHFSSCWVLTHG